MLGQTQTVTNQGTGAKYDIVVDEDMFAYGQECLDRYAHIPGERFVEVRVDISSLTPIPKQSGTADLIICSPGIIDVVDWKYGKGVKVFAEYNTQGLCYAWGAFERYDELFDFQAIRIHIGQPRLGHFDLWEIRRDQLHDFAIWARKQWALGWSGERGSCPHPRLASGAKYKLAVPPTKHSSKPSSMNCLIYSTRLSSRLRSNGGWWSPAIPK